MSKVVFAGCSFTAGSGWSDSPDIAQTDPRLWVNLCHTQINELSSLELVNLGIGGASNSEIFENAVKELANNPADIQYLFVQWTSMPRYNFNAGLETWVTTEKLHGNDGNRSKDNINFSDGTSWDRRYVNDLLDRFRALHHLHPEIVKVVSYTRIISDLCKQFNIKFAFINGLCPWDENYFVKLEGTDIKPENYTPFTKKEILNIEHKNDEDILKLYNQIHNDYNNAGGINSMQWVNLHKSMRNSQVDTNNDNSHPGIKSNQIYFEQIKTFIESQQGN
jgi:hypothetical protein